MNDHNSIHDIPKASSSAFFMFSSFNSFIISSFVWSWSIPYFLARSLWTSPRCTSRIGNRSATVQVDVHRLFESCCWCCPQMNTFWTCLMTVIRILRRILLAVFVFKCLWKLFLRIFRFCWRYWLWMMIKNWTNGLHQPIWLHINLLTNLIVMNTRTDFIKKFDWKVYSDQLVLNSSYFLEIYNRKIQLYTCPDLD